MKFIILTAFTLLFTTTISIAADPQSIPCDCTISNVPFLYFRFVKTCTVKGKFVVSQADTTIESLNGKKATDVAKNDASFFYIYGKTTEFIPKGLDQLFSNLTGMRFELTKLRHVTKENLAPFPQLLMFASVGNQIQFVEKDLFINNPNLKYVSFRSNKITYLDPTVFDAILPNLAHLFIDGTAITCGFSQATTNAAVGKVIEKLKTSPCGDIENAPPLYKFWVENQGGTGSDDVDCETKLAEKDGEIEGLKGVIRDLTDCIDDPSTCPARDQIQNLLRRQ